MQYPFNLRTHNVLKLFSHDEADEAHTEIGYKSLAYRSMNIVIYITPFFNFSGSSNNLNNKSKLCMSV